MTKDERASLEELAVRLELKADAMWAALKAFRPLIEELNALLDEMGGVR